VPVPPFIEACEFMGIDPNNLVIGEAPAVRELDSGVDKISKDAMF